MKMETGGGDTRLNGDIKGLGKPEGIGNNTATKDTSTWFCSTCSFRNNGGLNCVICSIARVGTGGGGDNARDTRGLRMRPEISVAIQEQGRGGTCFAHASSRVLNRALRKLGAFAVEDDAVTSFESNYSKIFKWIVSKYGTDGGHTSRVLNASIQELSLIKEEMRPYLSVNVCNFTCSFRKFESIGGNSSYNDNNSSNYDSISPNLFSVYPDFVDHIKTMIDLELSEYQIESACSYGKMNHKHDKKSLVAYALTIDAAAPDSVIAEMGDPQEVKDVIGEHYEVACKFGLTASQWEAFYGLAGRGSISDEGDNTLPPLAFGEKEEDRTYHAVVLYKIVISPNRDEGDTLYFKNSYGLDFGIEGTFSIRLPCKAFGELAFCYIKVNKDIPGHLLIHAKKYSPREETQLEAVSFLGDFAGKPVIYKKAIAKGADGVVFEGVLTYRNKEHKVAIKALPNCDPLDIYKIRDLRYAFNHKNIVNTFGFYCSPLDAKNKVEVRIVMKLAQHGTLRDAIENRKNAQPISWFAIFSDLISALVYLDNLKIVHGDICPDNILIDEVDGRLAAVLADFGSAIKTDASHSCLTVKAHEFYRAPECRLLHLVNDDVLQAYKQYTHKVDIYALGMVLKFMLTGSPETDIKDLRLGNVNNIVEWCAEAKPGKRPNALELQSLFPSKIVFNSSSAPSKEVSPITNITRYLFLSYQFRELFIMDNFKEFAFFSLLGLPLIIPEYFVDRFLMNAPLAKKFLASGVFAIRATYNFFIRSASRRRFKYDSGRYFSLDAYFSCLMGCLLPITETFECYPIARDACYCLIGLLGFFNEVNWVGYLTDQ